MSTPKNELYVITICKKLNEYISTINDNAPRKFRYSIIIKIDNECIELIKDIYLANNSKVNDPKRKEYQESAKVHLSMIDYIFLLGVKRQCYSSHQYEVMSKLNYDCLSYLNKWIMSDLNRNK